MIYRRPGIRTSPLDIFHLTYFRTSPLFLHGVGHVRGVDGLGSGVRVNASFQLFLAIDKVSHMYNTQMSYININIHISHRLTGGENALGGEGNCPCEYQGRGDVLHSATLSRVLASRSHSGFILKGLNPPQIAYSWFLLVQNV